MNGSIMHVPMEVETWLRDLSSRPIPLSSVLGINQARFIYEEVVPIFCGSAFTSVGEVAWVIGMYTPSAHPVTYPILELRHPSTKVILTLVYVSGKWAVSVDSCIPLVLKEDVYEHISGDPVLYAGLPPKRRYRHYIQSNTQFSFIVNGSHSLKIILRTLSNCINN